MKNNPKMTKRLSLQRLSFAIKDQIYKASVAVGGVFLCGALIVPTTAQASDVEIYLQSGDFNKRVMLMVDQSRAMGGAGLLDLVKDYPLCVGGGVTGILGEGGLNLGINVLGSDQVDGVVSNLLGLVDGAVLEGLLGGTLDPLLSVTAEKPSSEYPFERHHCTLVTTELVIDLLDGLLGPLLGVTGLSAKEYIEQTCDLVVDLALLEPVVGRSTLGLYRCYDKNSRVRMALTDMLNEKDAAGQFKLPNTTAVGLSLSPYDHTVNDRAGAVVSEPKLLNASYVVDGVTATHRQHLLNYIASDKMDNKAEFNLQNLLAIVPKLVGSLLTDVLQTVVNLLTDPFSAVNNLLNLSNTNNALNDVLKTLGLGGNNPLASTYAETGAYLLGNTTKGTGARQVIKKESLLAIAGVSLVWRHYRCEAWEADGSTCTKNGWDFIGLGAENTSAYKEVDANIINVLGLLSVGNQRIFYEYLPSVNTAFSGFNNSVPSTKKANTNFYAAPSAQPQCDANGLVVIAGGVPSISPTLIDALLLPKGSQSDATKYGLERLMGRSLDSTQNLAIKYSNGGDATRREWPFQCNSTDLRRTILGKDNTDFAAWQCIGAYARDIRALNANPIRTAVIGIDRSFLQLPTQVGGQPNFNNQVGLAQINAVQGMEDPLLTAFLPKVLRDILGGLGATLDLLLPGSIIGSGLTNSITSLLDQLLPKNPEDIKNMARWGVIGGGGWYNASNTENIKNSIQGFYDNLGISHYDKFLGNPIIPSDPLTPYALSNDVYQNMFVPNEKQSWLGNLKKYTAVDGQTIQTKNLKDLWGNSMITADNVLEGGVLSQLGLATASKVPTRRIYTNRDCIADSSNRLIYQQALGLKQIKQDYYTQKCNNSLDPYRQEFMALLGYNIQRSSSANNSQTVVESLAVDAQARKMGMSLHSTPLKITQTAKIKNGVMLQRNSMVAGQTVKEDDRDDYIVFGSTQGMLHVVKANSTDAGQEVFSFVPNEMLENTKQRRALTGNGLLGHGYFADMQYGVDGPWTAYSEYVWNSETDELTVGKSSASADCSVQLACGKQYLYGGLRMGGRSYYALDLSNLNQPQIKFHIDPASTQVIYKTGATQYDALAYMGQSWSKPTLAHVNWQGQRKLVMFVGGGYDAGGDDGNSNAGGYERVDYEQTNKKGAGVYMFDAETGALLWTASVNVQSSNTGTDNHALNTQMRHSVVSRINAVDRDNDGLMDHLYFGDLGGQVWRIDINNTATANTAFAKAAHIFNFDQHQFDSKLSDRFYEAPIFSLYGHGKSTLAVLSIATSNRSLPISDPSAGILFNLYDHSVTQTTVNNNDLSQGSLVNYTTPPQPNSLTLLTRPQYGWYSTFSNGRKVMDEMAVVNKNLYASVYDPGESNTVSCSAGLKGSSSVYRYCLPYGVCETGSPATGAKEVLKIGKGILPITIGAAGTAAQPARQVIGGDNRGATEEGISGQQLIRRQIVPLKWYEKNE